MLALYGQAHQLSVAHQHPYAVSQCILRRFLQTQLTSYATLKAHMEAKHPKDPIPPPEQFEK